MWKYKTPGIPDTEFERSEGIPITKEEARAIQVCKARLRPGHTVFDIGCGSGSIAVEAGLQVEENGRVFAVDWEPAAVELTKKNLAKFSVKNVEVLLGDARNVLAKLPEADVVFIGGTGGSTAEIIKLSQQKLKKGGRIIIGIILIETLYRALKILEELQFGSIEVTQISISKGRKTSTGTMMLARNPVYVVSATKV